MGQSPSKSGENGTSTAVVVPPTMKCVRLVEHVSEQVLQDCDGDYKQLEKYFEVAEVPTPKPRAGQVLVKIECSPINPSDVSTLYGSYNKDQRESLPCKLGFEASGTVVAVGSGLASWFMGGKRVAIASTGGGRMWAEYALCPALNCITLPDNVSFEEGCSCFVNPLTALAFHEIAAAGNHKALVHTAAASALGKMVLKLGLRTGVDVICLVRREQQKQDLEKIGAKYVVVTKGDWIPGFKEMAAKLNCRLGFDAVAGSIVGEILNAMPNKSTLHVYGGLSKQPISGISSSSLIFAGKQLKGFWLTPYIQSKNLLGKKAMLDNVAKYLKTDLGTEVRQKYALDSLPQALADYMKNMSGGKSCITPPLAMSEDVKVVRDLGDVPAAKEPVAKQIEEVKDSESS